MGALRVPIRIADSYVCPGDEHRYFPNHSHFLTRDEVLQIWPLGHITHEKFHHDGAAWRLAKGRLPQGNIMYLAVLDEAYSNGNGAAFQGSATPKNTTDISQRLRSMPLDAFPHHDVSDIASTYSDITPGYQSFSHAASAPAPAQPPRSNGSAALSSNSMRDRSGSQMALVAAQPAGALSLQPNVSLSFSAGGGFVTDLVAASENPVPLERYKAFIRLFHTLNQAREAMGLPPVTASSTAGPAWESPEAQDLVREIVRVGEYLCKFGTANMMDGGNNGSRAITSQDYAKLLQMYIEGHRALFQEKFICRLLHPLRTDAITVITLLQTRCTTNNLIYEQLVRHVGQEPAAGGAVVFNNSSVTANPTNHMLAAPRTLVNTVSNAWSKADVKRRTQIGLAGGAAAVMAFLVLKRKLFGGGGRSRRGGRDDDVESEWVGSSGRRSSRYRGDAPWRLMDERSRVERNGARFVAACQDELRRALHNEALLRNDWRLGPVRLAFPGSGNVPSGYEPVQTNYCNVESFWDAVEGATPPRRSQSWAPTGATMPREPAMAGSSAD